MSAEETVRAVPLAESGIGAIGQRLDAAKAAFAQAFNILRSLRDFDQCLSAAVNGPLIDALVKRDAPDAELADPSLSDEQYASASETAEGCIRYDYFSPPTIPKACF